MRIYDEINYNLDDVQRSRYFIEYVRAYPDVLDKLLSIWNAFNLEGLKSFLNELDLTVPYVAPPLSHRRYIENRDLISRIVRTESNYPTDKILDRYYLKENRIWEIYSSSAHEYDKVWDSVWTYEDRERVIQALSLSRGEKLLEVGIGTGNNVKHFLRDCHVTGIDFSHKALGICKKKIQDLSIDNIHLMEMDAHKLLFDDCTFDKILCFYTLCSVEDPFRVLEEIARVCVPGGTVVVYDVVRSDIPEVALLQYIFRPIARDLGAIYLEFCPPQNITYDSYFDLTAPILNALFKIKQATFLDPFHTVVLGIYENRPNEK